MRRPLHILATALVLSLGITLVPIAGGQSDPDGRTASAAEETETESVDDSYVVAFATHNIKCQRCGGNWAHRAHKSATMVQDSESNLISFQEVGPGQLRILRNRLPQYKFWPKRKLGTKDSQNQLAWHKQVYKPLKKGHIKVPVRGRMRAVPWVKLKVRNRHQGGGRVFYAISFHNSPRHREWERDRATEMQIQFINKRSWRKDGSMRPVFMMGDANERREFCKKVKQRTPLWAMNGSKGNPCPVPPGGPDWMVGTRKGVAYEDFRMRPAFESMHDFMTVKGRVKPSTKRAWRR